ncbi:DUF1311 domain-containing protein [bacterium]|nr:DUF1311 domain-containing protein [bacterium]
MKRIIVFFIFLLLFFVACFIQKSIYDNKIQLLNTELNNIKEENKFISDVNNKILNNTSPIDRNEKECLEKAVSTSESLECINKSLKEWDSEIEKYLGLLKQSMTNEEYKQIQTNQDLWITQNKSNNEIITQFVFNHGGTMYYQIASDYYVQDKKQRAEFLKAIYNTYNNEL